MVREGYVVGNPARDLHSLDPSGRTFQSEGVGSQEDGHKISNLQEKYVQQICSEGSNIGL